MPSASSTPLTRTGFVGLPKHDAGGFDHATVHSASIAHTLPSAANCHGSPAIGMVWSLRMLAARLRSIRDGLLEGFAASREYDRLTANGIPHDTALRRAFCVCLDSKALSLRGIARRNQPLEVTSLGRLPRGL